MFAAVGKLSLQARKVWLSMMVRETGGMFQRGLHFSLAVLLVVALVGCGSGDTFKGPRGTVKGKVTLKGAAVPEGCMVTFMSTEGYTATGKTAADGSYELIYQGGKKLPAVSYKAQVSPPASPASAEPIDMSKPTPPPPKAPFATKYGAASTSGLKFDVKEGDQTIDIELKE